MFSWSRERVHWFSDVFRGVEKGCIGFLMFSEGRERVHWFSDVFRGQRKGALVF